MIIFFNWYAVYIVIMLIVGAFAVFLGGVAAVMEFLAEHIVGFSLFYFCMTAFLIWLMTSESEHKLRKSMEIVTGSLSTYVFIVFFLVPYGLNGDGFIGVLIEIFVCSIIYIILCLLMGIPGAGALENGDSDLYVICKIGEILGALLISIGFSNFHGVSISTTLTMYMSQVKDDSSWDSKLFLTKYNTNIYSFFDHEVIGQCPAGEVLIFDEENQNNVDKNKEYKIHYAVLSGDGVRGYVKASDVKKMNVDEIKSEKKSEQIELYQASSSENPVRLLDLIDGKKQKIYTEQYENDNTGEEHFVSIREIEQESKIELNKNYKTISGTLFLEYKGRTSKDLSYLILYNGEEVIYFSPPIMAGVEPFSFSVDVSNVDVLTIDFITDNEARLTDCVLEGLEKNIYFEEENTDSSSGEEENEESKNYVKLYDLDYIDQQGLAGWIVKKDRRGNLYKDNKGNTYDEGMISCYDSSYAESYIEYDLNGEYKRMTGTVNVSWEMRSRSELDKKCGLWIFGDGKELYSCQQPDVDMEPQLIDLDISGVERLRIKVAVLNTVNLADPVVYTESDGKVFSSQRKPVYANPAAISRMEYTKSANGNYIFGKDNTAIDIFGNSYVDIVAWRKMDLRKDNWETYRIDGEYTLFSGTLIDIPYKNAEAAEEFLYVYGDDRLLYSSPPIGTGQSGVEFAVDVTGVELLKMVFDGRNHIALSNGILTK